MLRLNPANAPILQEVSEEDRRKGTGSSYSPKLRVNRLHPDVLAQLCSPYSCQPSLLTHQIEQSALAESPKAPFPLLESPGAPEPSAGSLRVALQLRHPAWGTRIHLNSGKLK